MSDSSTMATASSSPAGVAVFTGAAAAGVTAAETLGATTPTLSRFAGGAIASPLGRDRYHAHPCPAAQAQQALRQERSQLQQARAACPPEPPQSQAQLLVASATTKIDYVGVVRTCSIA